MNWVWTIFSITSLTILIFINPEMAFNSFLSGGEKGITLSLKLWGIYAVWLGILQIVEDTKLDKKLANILSPIINLLFGKTNPALKEQLSINITANIFGMGNACTPSGIKSMELMDKGETYATTSMITLLILNSANLQIIPTTIIGLRILNGSTKASSIILPTIIGSLASVISGLILIKICSKIFVRNPNKKLKNKPTKHSYANPLCTISNLNKSDNIFASNDKIINITNKNYNKYITYIRDKKL